jgi:hypothetical protein
MPDDGSLLAQLYGATYWLLYYRVAEEVFPGIQPMSFSKFQDVTVTGRVDDLIRAAAARLAPGSAAPSKPAAPSTADAPHSSAPGSPITSGAPVAADDRYTGFYL